MFRIVRHPNYYLSVIPELIGFAIFFHAWGTLLKDGYLFDPVSEPDKGRGKGNEIAV